MTNDSQRPLPAAPRRHPRQPPWWHRFLNDLRAASVKWHQDDGSLLAAAVAYYMALSFFPLLLILIAGFGLFLQWTPLGQDAEQQVLSVVAEYSSPAVERQVRQALSTIEERALLSGPLGVLTLLAASIAIFAHFQRAFDRIWNVVEPKQPGWLQHLLNVVLFRLKAFLMLLGLGALVLVTFLIVMALTTLKAHTRDVLPTPWMLWPLEVGVSFFLNALLFALIFRVVPKASVRWSEAIKGGMLTAVVWEIGRQVLAAFLIGGKYSAYGIIGSFIAVLLWVYYGCAAVFWGAEYVQLLWRRRVQEPQESGQNRKVDA